MKRRVRRVGREVVPLALDLEASGTTATAVYVTDAAYAADSCSATGLPTRSMRSSPVASTATIPRIPQ